MTIKTRAFVEREATCNTVEELSSALRVASEDDLPEDTELEIYIDVELPGIGKRRLRLLDEVSVQVRWRSEVET